jgi:hypothetical protein
MINGNQCNSFGNGAIGVVMVPLQMLPAGGAPGAGTPSGSAATIPYSPLAGSALAGTTTVGGALDKTGELLKLLNAAGFATAADGSIPVYNAATGQFVPSTTPLTPAQGAALLKLMYAAGQPGAFLQRQADGSIAAVPFLDALKLSNPGTASGDTLKWDAATSKWIVAPASSTALSAATLAGAIAALPAGVLAKVSGVDAAGNAVTATPSAMVAAGVAGAPAGTAVTLSGVDAAGNLVSTTPVQVVKAGLTAAPTGSLATVSGLDAAGNVVKSTPLVLLKDTVTAAPASTATNTLSKIAGVDATGNPVKSSVLPLATVARASSGSGATVLNQTTPIVTLATVTAPVDGVYAVKVEINIARKAVSGTPIATQPNETAYFVDINGVFNPTNRIFYVNDVDYYPMIRTGVTDAPMGNFSYTKTVAVVALKAGDTVPLKMFCSGIVTSYKSDNAGCFISLQEVGNRHIDF